MRGDRWAFFAKLTSGTNPCAAMRGKDDREDYTITIYLNQYWKDERLAFSDRYQDNMTLTGDFADRIWVPDTFFANDKQSFLHDVTEKNKMIRLHGDGSIAYGMSPILQHGRIRQGTNIPTIQQPIICYLQTASVDPKSENFQFVIIA
ncbi:hypothetical protein LSH36_84g03012 [Paralvinella palmiformis]|uniref:Neurotransmitter-gated ion-channel ligand-binding domain-containing protein n=1 Tax=Paralvinella palmiformis TaxID=53620 RepID=A0AAD9NAR5_9ANNE|nr:hypothetical protein LSH36_84g03012 [Paralvinella palmiformis]